MRPTRSTLFWNRVLGGMHVSRLLRDGVGTFVLKGVNAGFTFLSTVLLARLLGAEGYGFSHWTAYFGRTANSLRNG